MRLAGGVAQHSVWRPTAAAVWPVGHIHSTVRQQEAFVAWQVAGVWAAGGLVRHALGVPTAAAVWPAGVCTQCRSKLEMGEGALVACRSVQGECVLLSMCVYSAAYTSSTTGRTLCDVVSRCCSALCWTDSARSELRALEHAQTRQGPSASYCTNLDHNYLQYRYD